MIQGVITLLRNITVVTLAVLDVVKEISSPGNNYGTVHGCDGELPPLDHGRDGLGDLISFPYFILFPFFPIFLFSRPPVLSH